MKNYLSEMLYALTSAYSRKDYDNHQQGRPLETNIGKLFSLFAWGLDIVQENAELVKQWDDLEAAKGAVLDRYGANWGVQRFSENDTLYRLAIRVKILSQLSGGDTDTVIRAAADLLGVENHDIEFEDVFPAKIALYVDWLLLTQERQDLIEPIAWAIKRIVAGGVGMRLYVRTYRTFRYDLSVYHGGAIGTFFHYDPVGKDRLERMELFVAHGGAVLADFPDTPPVGEDRAYLEPVFVARQAADVAVFQDAPPIGEDKTFSQPVFVAHEAVSIPDFLDVPPVNKDRVSSHTVFSAHKGASTAIFPDASQIGQDRTSQHSVSVSRTGHAIPAVTGTPPDVARIEKLRQSGAGGAYTRTHIKPKRID